MGAPFERIANDTAGPFAYSNRENRYFLVTVDCLMNEVARN